jgi:8-oxo-dGTP pyrophosphatase MutT (NUDIX family)
MQTKDDISYGVIPLIKEGDTWLVFLINQFGHAGDVYWTFPKGHPEEGEIPEESALRELREETAITLKLVQPSKWYEQLYVFPYKEFLINKKVLYLIGEAVSKDYAIQEDEVKEAGWFSFEDAREKLTHEVAKNLLDTVLKDIEIGLLNSPQKSIS